MTIPAFPLSWPPGWERTHVNCRVRGRFSTRSYSSRMATDVTVAEAVTRVRRELERMGLHADDIVISTNISLRQDGFPRSNQPEPPDPGAAVYWRTRSGVSRCMAIDRYTRVADNLAAIAATLDAMRAIERHGGAEILDRAFTGFVAIEHEARAHWSDVLGVPRTAIPEAIEAAYRRLRAQHHPDRGGDAEAFMRVQKAYEEATQA